MATQALTQKTLAKAGFISTTGANWQTMTSGAGNGSVVAAANADVLVLYNDTVSSVDYTIKAAQTSEFSGRSITVPDMTVTVAAAGFAVVPVSSVFNSAGNITVEADGTAKIACLSHHELD